MRMPRPPPPGAAIAQRLAAARQHRHPGGGRRLAGLRLVAHGADHSRARPDPAEPALLEHLGEMGVLGQEAVAGMDGVGAGDLGRRDDARDVEIAGRRGGRADADVLVGIGDVQAVAVGGRADGDGLDAELAARLDDPQGDLAAVGDEDLLEHAGRSGGARSAGAEAHHGALANSGSPNSTAWAFWGKISVTTPSMSDSISFISFIASMMHITWPLRTREPTSTKGGASGDGAR